MLWNSCLVCSQQNPNDSSLVFLSACLFVMHIFRCSDCAIGVGVVAVVYLGEHYSLTRTTVAQVVERPSGSIPNPQFSNCLLEPDAEP